MFVGIANTKETLSLIDGYSNDEEVFSIANVIFSSSSRSCAATEQRVGTIFGIKTTESLMWHGKSQVWDYKLTNKSSFRAANRGVKRAATNNM